MSTFAAPTPATEVQIVDLASMRAFELEEFFRRELLQWRELLYWDVSSAVASLRRALDRGSVSGRAVRSGSSTAGFGYFTIEGDRGVISGLSVAPQFRGSEAARLLLRALIVDLERRGVRRIESQFVSFDPQWIARCYESEGFATYWREFRRLALARPRMAPETALGFRIMPWRAWNLAEAAVVMQSAHAEGVDAEMNELYRTGEGCRMLLTNVLRQRGCGTAVTEASAVARERGSDRVVGFAVTTETAPRQAHLAQIAVAPGYQRQGVGRQLLAHTIARLLDRGFTSLSLMVSVGNERAVRLYQSMGFDSVVRFPVFSLDRF